MKDKVIKRKKYRIKGNSQYFKKKYGTSNPIIQIEGTDEEVFGGRWAFQNGNPACLIFGIRTAMEEVGDNKVYYGKIEGFGELVDESELEEV